MLGIIVQKFRATVTRGAGIESIAFFFRTEPVFFHKFIYKNNSLDMLFESVVSWENFV